MDSKFRVFNLLSYGGETPWGTMVGTRREVADFLYRELAERESNADNVSAQNALRRISSFARGRKLSELVVQRWNGSQPVAHFLIRDSRWSSPDHFDV